ncbi:PREDICTED: acid phosphatase [Prunus dulcis]|uniref:PREDICTED: acid phosphatase n=1 Tax=Prunus dulcis TaxID=3755 RepID=A0A5E4ETR0_PRUDU|nr:hypothetical protein L3X38_019937 [Prunus dulcis]VVA19104.1 PREDICTED: acid phosphatase [Prunus dulcis]
MRNYIEKLPLRGQGDSALFVLGLCLVTYVTGLWTWIFLGPYGEETDGGSYTPTTSEGRPISIRAAMHLPSISPSKLFSSLLAPGDQGKLATVYKSEKRNEMEKEGYRILGNSGDQWSDILGTSISMSIRSFKLPNPMYYIP